MGEIVFKYDPSTVGGRYQVIGILKIFNGCCKHQPVLVTKTFNEFMEKDIYSCQCGCGMWCSNGFENMPDAIADYMRMSTKPYWREEDGQGLDIST